jgi:hypothetical protein
MASVILPNQRLNPKLTRRQSVTAVKVEDTVEVENELSTTKAPPLIKDCVKAFFVFIRDSDSIPEADEDSTMRKKDPYSALNAPMLVTQLSKHFDEVSTAISALGFVLKHAEEGEGCVLLLKYGILSTIFKVHLHEPYVDHKEIQLLVASVLKQLLECNYTRDSLIDNLDVLRVTFSIAHRFMSSADHVTASIHCILQCARSEINREEIMSSNMIGYFTNFCKRHSKVSLILRCVLKLFCWLSITDEKIEQLCEKEALGTCLQCMKRHICDANVLAPGIRFLTRASSLPWCKEYILEKKAIAMIIKALRTLYDEAELQLAGLKMLQSLSLTEEGYRQISEAKGGWQSICQGTTMGNALIHDLESDFNNPGWCIGDTPNLTLLDR